MKRTDGNEDMERFIGGPTDDALDAAIHGSPSSDPVVAGFVEKLRAVADQPPSDASMAIHVAMAARAARRAAVPAGDAAAPVVRAAGSGRLARLRRRIAYVGVSSGLAFKMLFGAVAVAAVTGGAAAATGNLPDAWQDTVASMADRIGISLPAGGENSEIVAADDGTEDTTDTTNSASIQGAEQQERARAYAAAVNEWTQCVQDREKAEDGSKAAPAEACGEHPDPKDFGLPSEDNGRPEDPGKDSAPGQDRDEPPGNSGDAPGGNDADGPPGNSGDAPGRNDADGPPGNSGDAPGQNDDAVVPGDSGDDGDAGTPGGGQDRGNRGGGQGRNAEGG